MKSRVKNLYLSSTSPPLSPSPSKERGKKKKEGLPPLSEMPCDIIK
jgi:hypothetical protein